MLQLKDIAARMDNCCVRTAKRWWKKLQVPPDVVGHGPHRWHDHSAERLLKLWSLYYARRGTSPQIVKLKYAGRFTDKNQLPLPLKYHDEKSRLETRPPEWRGAVPPPVR